MVVGRVGVTSLGSWIRVLGFGLTVDGDLGRRNWAFWVWALYLNIEE